MKILKIIKTISLILFFIFACYLSIFFKNPRAFSKNAWFMEQSPLMGLNEDKQYVYIRFPNENGEIRIHYNNNCVDVTLHECTFKEGADLFWEYVMSRYHLLKRKIEIEHEKRLGRIR